MQFTAMLKPKYSTILAVTGLDDEDENETAERDQKKESLKKEDAQAREEKDAKTALLNHVLLERYGMDMGGRLGLNRTRGKLAEIYIRTTEGKTPEEKAKAAVRKVDEIIKSFNVALDKLRFPNMAVQGHGR